jgi:hypothetical protein
MALHLVQFLDDAGRRRVGVPSPDGSRLQIVADVTRVYDVALAAIRSGVGLDTLVRGRLSNAFANYDDIVRSRRLLPPVDHPDPAHLYVTGTGLTHLGSADTRDQMHRTTVAADEVTLTDSMKMFRWGLEGGKPADGLVGVQPEWFYKGNGRFVVAPEQPLTMPAFAEDGGEEPELAGLYVIAPDGTPVRLGVALGNEFSDHVVERRNYLLLAHSKLRQSAFGPELVTGPVPDDIRGVSRILRHGTAIYERPFLTGEANMSHTLANLEHHHFKYAEHRVPGDVHVHYFGTATLSVAAGIKTEAGDVFEIEAEDFGRPLRNALAHERTGREMVRVRGA